MKKIISAFGAAALAVVVVGLTTFAPAMAAPAAPARVQVTSDVEMAQYRDRDDRPRWDRRHNDRYDRRDRDRYDRRDRDRRHGRYDRHDNRPGYWNGHRGYREYRRGYRRHSDGYYYSPEVFQLFFRF